MTDTLKKLTAAALGAALLAASGTGIAVAAEGETYEDCVTRLMSEGADQATAEASCAETSG